MYTFSGVILNGHHVVGPNSFPNDYAILRGVEVFSDLKKLVMSGLEGVHIFVVLDLMDLWSNWGFSIPLSSSFRASLVVSLCTK